jgi:uroporphyrinogen-III decarboxylase
MTTGMERLAAAFEGRILDRIPIFCNLIDQGAKELGMPIEEYYSKGENVAEAQLMMRAKYGYDNLFSLFYVGTEAMMLGCRKIRFAKDGPPNVEELVIQSPADVDKLIIPDDLSEHPVFQESLKCMRLLRAAAGGKYPICAYVTASMTLPVLLMGMDKWLELLLMGPADVRDQLLEKCSDFFRKHIAAYRQAGADVIVYSNPFGSTDIIPMKLFRDVSLKWMRRDLEPGGVQGVVYYAGGARLNSVINEVLESLKITTFYPSPLEDITESMKIINGRALCAGIINDIALIDWSRDQIRSEVRRLVHGGLRLGRRFFFGTMVMPYCIPEDSIRIMLEAACEFGTPARLERQDPS